MTVSRVLPSYPPTYHTREVIPTDSWSYRHPSVTQDTNIYILSAVYFLLRLQTYFVFDFVYDYIEILVLCDKICIESWEKYIWGVFLVNIGSWLDQ